MQPIIIAILKIIIIAIESVVINKRTPVTIVVIWLRVTIVTTDIPVIASFIIIVLLQKVLMIVSMLIKTIALQEIIELD